MDVALIKGALKREKLFSPFWCRMVGLGVTYLEMYAKHLTKLHSVSGSLSKVTFSGPPLFTILGKTRVYFGSTRSPTTSPTFTPPSRLRSRDFSTNLVGNWTVAFALATCIMATQLGIPFPVNFRHFADL